LAPSRSRVQKEKKKRRCVFFHAKKKTSISREKEKLAHAVDFYPPPGRKEKRRKGRYLPSSSLLSWIGERGRDYAIHGRKGERVVAVHRPGKKGEENPFPFITAPKEEKEEGHSYMKKGNPCGYSRDRFSRGRDQKKKGRGKKDPERHPRALFAPAGKKEKGWSDVGKDVPENEFTCFWAVKSEKKRRRRGRRFPAYTSRKKGGKKQKELPR